MAQASWFVYCYLRIRSNRPYYIGIGSRPDRMTARHSCKVPRDHSRIRVMRRSLTREQAVHWEKFYIARYGRKDLGTGILVNRTDGGDATVHGPEALEKIRQAARRPENIERLRTINVGRKMHPRTREALLAAAVGRKRTEAERKAASERQRGVPKSPETVSRIRKTRMRNTAVRLGIPCETWMAMTPKERNTARMWLVNNPDRSADEYFAGARRKSGPQPSVDAAEVRRLVLEEGLTQAAVADRLGCSRPYVSRIIRGERQAGIG